MLEMLAGDTSQKPPPILVKGWNKLEGPLEGRSQATSCVYNGFFYIFGGMKNSGNSFNTVSILNLKTGVWIEKSITQNVFLRAAGALVGDKFYIHGGYNGSADSRTMIEFTLNGYDVTAALKATGPVVRNSHAAAELNGEVWMTGGMGATILSRTDVYNPATDSWRVVGSPIVRRYHTLVNINNALYFHAGTTAASSGGVGSLHTSSGGAGWVARQTSPQTRYLHGAVGVGEKLYVLGGAPTPGVSTIIGDNLLMVYDTVGNTWATVPYAEDEGPGRRSYPNINTYEEGFVVSGGRFNGLDIDDCWVYIP